jgi:hypothetical protein
MKLGKNTNKIFLCLKDLNFSSNLENKNFSVFQNMYRVDHCIAYSQYTIFLIILEILIMRSIIYTESTTT